MIERSISSFKQVSNMNTAFGNPKGDFNNINKLRLLKQFSNIFDEYVELLSAFGFDKSVFEAMSEEHRIALGLMTDVISLGLDDIAGVASFDVDEIRDAACDIQVFAMGGQHFMGVDGDADMKAVVDGVMTRFIKNDSDKQATIEYHAARGVSNVYFEGNYPTMVMKSAEDQPDAPKGKFLKSASYSATKFPKVFSNVIENGGIPIGMPYIIVSSLT